MAMTTDEFEKSGYRLKPRDDGAFGFDIVGPSGEPLSRSAAGDLFRRDDDVAFVPDRPRVLGEGDSWINILWPLSDLLGHEISMFEVIEDSGKYNALNIGWPGAELSEILRDKQYLAPIGSGLYDHFVFSAAGNDIVGGKNLRTYLKKREDVDPGEPVESWLNGNEIDAAIARIRAGYEEVAAETKAASSGRTQLYVHCYDYVQPRRDGDWIWPAFEDRGYAFDSDMAMMQAVVVHLIDRLYDVLRRLAENEGHVTLVDTRDTVRGRWNDELHPKAPASNDLAALFYAKMDAVV